MPVDQFHTGFFSLVRRWHSHAPPFFCTWWNLCHEWSCYRSRLDTNYSLYCAQPSLEMYISDKKVSCEMRTHQHQVSFWNLILYQARHVSFWSEKQSRLLVFQRVFCVFGRDLSSYRVPEWCRSKVVAARQRKIEKSEDGAEEWATLCHSINTHSSNKQGISVLEFGHWLSFFSRMTRQSSILEGLQPWSCDHSSYSFCQSVDLSNLSHLTRFYWFQLERTIHCFN